MKKSRVISFFPAMSASGPERWVATLRTKKPAFVFGNNGHVGNCYLIFLYLLKSIGHHPGLLDAIRQGCAACPDEERSDGTRDHSLAPHTYTDLQKPAFVFGNNGHVVNCYMFFLYRAKSIDHHPGLLDTSRQGCAACPDEERSDGTWDHSLILRTLLDHLPTSQ